MTRRSLAARLSTALVVATVLVAGLAGVLSYQRSLTEARGLQDDVLLQVASLAASSTNIPATDREPLSDSASDIDVTTLSASGLTADPGRGPRSAVLDGVETRVVVVPRSGAEPLVVSQAVQVRDEAARAAALSATLPLALLLPVLLVAIVVGVRRVLAPVDRLAREVEGRAAGDLGPLHPGRMPTELTGFLAALDRLFGRVKDAQDHERRFIAQAAHELRTPLTAMSLQLERAATAPDPASVRDRIEDTRAGIDRSRRLVDQLLDLARAQADDADGAPRTEPFDTVLRDALSDVLHLADERGVRVEVPTGGEDHTPVPAIELGAALRNLVDNAVRHGPEGGLVTLTALRTPGRFTVTVEDEGPGLRDPDAVLQPFVREAGQDVVGSGLGLAVVVGQLRRIGGSLTLTPRAHDVPGLRAVISVPLPDASQGALS